MSAADGFARGFRVEETESDRSVTISVSGELDSGTCDALLEAFEQAIARDDLEELVLDLAGVSFIDSTGMRTIIEIERDLGERGARLVLVPPPDDVTALLQIAGIAERMNFVEAGAGALGPDFLDRVAIELEREPAAPSRARAEVREALAQHLDAADLSTVVLLTSELVTNAVVHPTRTVDATIGLEISVHEQGVRVEVEDSGEGFNPVAPKPSPTQRGGRGLFLVDRCAASWGAGRDEREPGARFCVWFEFASGEREAAAAQS
jgi:anti-sigma B factor antagonist